MRLLNKIHIFLLMLMVTILSACSSSEAPETIDVTKLGEPVSMYISVPTDTTSSGKTRVGDPGSDAQVKQDWDKLVIIVAYKNKATTGNDYDAEPGRMVYWDTFDKADFDKNERIEHSMSILDAPEKNNGTRAITMYLPVGTVNVYGVTYSDDCGFNLVDSLSKIKKDGYSHASEIEALQISNDYAQGQKDELAKFLSVATGFGVNTQIADTAAARTLTITKGKSEVEMKQYWAMRLTRLATQLDIQWDAYQGYHNGNLVDCKVTSFQYDGGATTTTDGTALTGSGNGRLFPYLNKGKAAVGGKKYFINQTPISQRNGRVYHYLFPDGSASPKITFNLELTTKDPSTGAETETKHTPYTFNLSGIAPLKQAYWYKINTKIKGASANSETTIGQAASQEE